MKSIPWILTLAFAATSFFFYSKMQQADANLANLQAANEEIEALREEVDELRRVTVDQNEVERLRKENEEVYRLRNEVSKLQKETKRLNQELQAKQVNAQLVQNEQPQDFDPVTQPEPPPDPQADFQRQQAERCIQNLHVVEEAKTMWAVAHSKNAGENVTLADITTALPNNTMPICPAGGIYNLNQVGIPVSCSVPGHSLLP